MFGHALRHRKEGPAAPFLAVGAAALGAMGTLKQGQAQASAMKTNAAIARQNATLKQQAATVEEGRTRRIGNRGLARLEARIGKSGVVRSGSVLDIISESAKNVELDALNVRYQGVLEAHSFLTTAAMQEAGAKNTMKAARLSAATQLLSGAFSAASVMPGTPPSTAGLSGSAAPAAGGAQTFMLS